MVSLELSWPKRQAGLGEGRGRSADPDQPTQQRTQPSSSRVPFVFQANRDTRYVEEEEETRRREGEEGESARRITTEVIRAARCKLAAGSLPGSAGTSYARIVHIFLPMHTRAPCKIHYFRASIIAPPPSLS